MRSGYYSGAKDCDAPEYKAWRAKVYRRDGYTCRLCGAKGVTLNAHHIKRWKDKNILICSHLHCYFMLRAYFNHRIIHYEDKPNMGELRFLFEE